MGQSSRAARGFTIVETLIVLTVSMALFVSAVLLINGKQQATAFNQAVRTVQTDLTQVIGQVGSGYYQNDGTVLCSENSGVPVITGGGTDSQGRSSSCLFLGKVIQFGMPAVGGDEIYNIYTVVGLNSAVTGGTVSLTNGKARLLAVGSADGGLASPIPDNQFDTKKLQYGLTVSTNYYTTHPNSVAAVGFISNLSTLGTDDGSQRVDVLAIKGVGLGTDKLNGVKLINDGLYDPSLVTLDPTQGVQICLNSGGTDQSALLTIGGDGRQGTVGTQIFNGKDCS